MAIVPLLLTLTLSLVLCWVMPANSFAACTNDPGAAQKAASFLGDTGSLLNGPNGPRSMAEISADVRDFVAANPQALAAVISMIKAVGLTPDQQKALGTGLGLAAGICIRPDPTFAAEIQTQLVGTDSADAKQAFAAITGNQLIGSTGGGAGGAGSSGSVGGQTTPFTSPTGGGSSPVAFTSNSVSNTPGNFFGGATGAAGSVSTTTGTTTNTTVTNVACVVSSASCP
jgi:hypothetical protein